MKRFLLFALVLALCLFAFAPAAEADGRRVQRDRSVGRAAATLAVRAALGGVFYGGVSRFVQPVYAPPLRLVAPFQSFTDVSAFDAGCYHGGAAAFTGGGCYSAPQAFSLPLLRQRILLRGY